MRVVVPPGQGIFTVEAYLSLSREEASEFRDALDLMLSTGSSGWQVFVSWGDNESDVRMTLELNPSENPLNPV